MALAVAAAEAVAWAAHTATKRKLETVLATEKMAVAVRHRLAERAEEAASTSTTKGDTKWRIIYQH